MILASACLLGLPCRYDARGCPDRNLMRMLKEGRPLLPVCPEQLGGLPTPRPAVELAGGDGSALLQGKARALTREGEDLSAAFRRGAQAAVELAMAAGVSLAVLKEGSPSCGVSRVRDGTFKGRWMPGLGVTAALLGQHGIKVYSAETCPDEIISMP